MSKAADTMQLHSDAVWRSLGVHARRLTGTHGTLQTVSNMIIRVFVQQSYQRHIQYMMQSIVVYAN